jgi:hypothetical protein
LVAQNNMAKNRLKQAITAAHKLQVARKSRIENFVLHVYLVVIGVRDGYLVDEFCTDEATMISLIESFVHVFGLSKSVVLISLATGDFIIASADSIIRKYEPEWLRQNHIIVDISGSEPMLLEDTILIEAQVHIILRETFAICSSLDGCSKSKVHPVSLILPEHSTVGYEFIAGFLLGYACIYNCPRDKIECLGIAGGALSMQALLKASISVTITGEGMSSSSRGIVAQEYTIPEYICALNEVDMKRRRILEETISRIRRAVSDGASAVCGVSEPIFTEESVTSAFMSF